MFNSASFWTQSLTKVSGSIIYESSIEAAVIELVDFKSTLPHTLARGMD